MVLLVLSGLCVVAVVAMMLIGIAGAAGGRDVAMDERMARRQERLDQDDATTDRLATPTSLPPRPTSRPAGGADDAAA